MKCEGCTTGPLDQACVLQPPLRVCRRCVMLQRTQVLAPGTEVSRVTLVAIRREQGERNGRRIRGLDKQRITIALALVWLSS